MLVSARIVFHHYSHKIDTVLQRNCSFYIVCSLANDTFLFDHTKNPIRIDFDNRLTIGTNCVYRYGTMYSANGDTVAPVLIHVYETQFKHVPLCVYAVPDTLNAF